MKYKDLSDKAKERAYNDWLPGAANYEWWDCVYEMAKEDGKKLGFDIDDIEFSGFWSQGDGASWSGEVELKVWVDSEACTLGDREKLFLKTALEEEIAETPVKIDKRGRYCHSGTMQSQGIGVLAWADTEDDEIESGPYAGMNKLDFIEELEKLEQDIDEALIESARNYADKIYKQLEEEYEYITSEKFFAENCEALELEFDEEGNEL